MVTKGTDAQISVWGGGSGGRIRKGSREEESCVCASAPFPCCSFCLDHTCQTLKQLVSHPSHPAWRSPSSPERAPLTHPHGITLFTAHPSSQWFLLICFDGFHFCLLFIFLTRLWAPGWPGPSRALHRSGSWFLAEGLTHSRCSKNRKDTQSIDPRPRSQHMQLVWRKGKYRFCTVIERWKFQTYWRSENTHTQSWEGARKAQPRMLL